MLTGFIVDGERLRLKGDRLSLKTEKKLKFSYPSHTLNTFFDSGTDKALYDKYQGYL